MRQLRNSKGFTLIELMIVVVIIGILAAIAIPKFSSVSTSAKQAEAGPILKQICSLASSDYQRTDAWPTSITTITGWDDSTNTNSKYFTFTFDAASTSAKAAVKGTVAGLKAQDMNCLTGVITTAA